LMHLTISSQRWKRWTRDSQCFHTTSQNMGHL